MDAPTAPATPSDTGPDYRVEAYNDATEAGIDPEVFVRQIDQGSGFDPSAVGPAGAVGIAQIVPQYHPGVDATDPSASLQYAAHLMRGYLDRYNGDYSKALAAYSAGPGAVDQYNGVPPYAETQNYVDSILGGGGGGTGGGAGGGPASDTGPSPSPDPWGYSGGADSSGAGDDPNAGQPNPLGDLLGWLGGMAKGVMVGGAPQPTEPPFDPNVDPIGQHITVPGGTQVTYQRPDGTWGIAFQKNVPKASTTKTLDGAAAAAGYFNPDGTPDTQGYLDAMTQKHTATKATGTFHVMPNGDFVRIDPDGTVHVVGNYAKPTTSGRVINLGGGRYLTLGPSGEIQQHEFPQAEKPVTRPEIVDYLRSLLGQNGPPYNGVAQVTPQPPALTQQPPALGAPPPLAAPAVTPTAAPAPDLLSILKAQQGSPITAAQARGMVPGGNRLGQTGFWNLGGPHGAQFSPELTSAPVLH